MDMKDKIPETGFQPVIEDEASAWARKIAAHEALKYVAAHPELVIHEDKMAELGIDVPEDYSEAENERKLADFTYLRLADEEKYAEAK